MPEIKPEIETFAKIKVVGVGGSGGEAVNRMITAKIKGVEFISVNTDVQALNKNSAKKKIHIGQLTTRGLGAGMDPDIGYQSAQENINEIREALKGADMVFVTCGLGGGTGSGGSHVIASVAKELGALVVAIVTKPFGFEGAQRMEIAERAHNQLMDSVDTIITIPNDKILQIIDKKTPMMEAFKIVDDVLRQGIQGISEVITVPADINVDFADVKSIMFSAGSALMGIGQASGENRAIEAAKKAIHSPLLDISIDGAKGILFTIAGGKDMAMSEVDEAAKIITETADPNARIIFGTLVDENLKDKIRITVIATGFAGSSATKQSSQDNGYKLSGFFSSKAIKDKPSLSESKDDKPKRVKEEMEQRSKLEPKQTKEYKEENIEQENRPLIKPDDFSEDEDLEVPAFIRRKMK